MINELKLGPKESEFDRKLALDEIERKINEIIRELNSLLEGDSNESTD